MINIYDSTGNVILSPLTGSDAERVEELMSQDYAQLAWQSDSGTTIPAGSYIMLGGEKLTLLDPYEPEQKDEAEWSYRPKFQSHVMGWGKVPFFHYTYGADNAITAREPDWTLTDTPSNFMASVCKAIKNETGETWTYEIAGDIIATTITLSFSSADILSGLGQIAGGYDTEWRADKSTNTLYLGKAQHGTAVTLQVDSNVGVPSVTRNKEGYYNRFYIFGSTRNITQDYQGANVNGLVNKRLTLDPAVYPGGYIDIPRASGTPVFPKILTFDDIYPHSGLTVADLRPRLMYRLDTDGNKVQVGTDSSGNAVYDMYTIWYFQLPGFTLNDSTYSKDNPTGMLISGKALSVHFKSGALTGREFELIYHHKAENLHNSDGQDFYVKAGDYEIKFIEENGLIIPMQTGIVPATGDEVILFNIRMPQEYVATAYTELKEAALKEISDRYTSDLNNYTIKSNPVAFADSDPGLSIGQKVLYVNGDYSYETRVIKLVRKLDIPSEQEITIGSEKVKGNSETLKEEVVNANSNIDILTQLNQLTQNVVQAYQRTQQLMLDGLGKLGRMWEFDPDDPNVIYTKYNFYGKGWGSVLGKNPGAGTIAAGATTLGGLNNVTELADSVTAADKVLIRRAGEAQWTLANLSDIVGLDTTALATYLSNNHYAKTSDIPSLAEYATRTWVQQQGYLTEHQSLAAYLTKTLAAQTYQPIGDYATNSALTSAINTLNTAIGKKLDAATFDDLFVKEADGKGGYRIKARYALYSNQYLSCLGNNPDAGTVALGATTLGGLNNVVAAADEVSAAAKVLVREAGSASWSLKSLSDIVGLDTAALATYLSNNGYATKTWVQAQGYLTAITKAQVEAVLTGDITTHTHSQYLTSVLAAQTYQPKGDYALNSALNSAVSSLNTAIGKKLDASVFDDLFAKESDGNGGYRIRAKYAIYSNQYISCLGNNPGAGTTTGGGVDLDAVRDYLTQQGYATQQWVQAQGYLKAADLSAYALADNAYLKNQQNRKSNAHTVASLTAVANSSDSWVNNYSLSLVNNNNALNFYVGGVENERQALIQSGHSSNGYAQVLGVLHLNKLGGAVYINNSLALNAANVGSYAVTLDTEQEIPGKKTFTATETAVNRRLYVNGAFDAFGNYPHYMWRVAGTQWTKAVMDTSGNIHFVEGGARGFASYKSIKALAFVVAGGTSSQILMADGSVGDELAYLRYRGVTTTDADNTLWSQIGLKSYHNALPDGLSGVYNYGEAISFAGNSTRFDMYVNHHSSDGTQNGKGIYYRSGWGTDKRPWQLLLDTNNYASVLDSRYFRAAGIIPTAYVDLTTYTPGATGYANYQSGAYQVQRSGHSELLVNLAINGGSTSALQFYTSYGNDAALKYRKTVDANRVSGPWRTIVTDLNIGSYALTPSNYTSTLDGRYVNASGDTMTGALNIANTASHALINAQYNSAGAYSNVIWANKSEARVIFGSPNWATVELETAPTATAAYRRTNGAQYKLWDSGNDGAGSGLDADLLDGLHLADIRRGGYAMQETWIDASSLDVNTYYPVVMGLPANANVRLEVIVALDSGTKPSWSTHAKGYSCRLIWESNGNGWGTTPTNRTIYASDYAYTSSMPVCGIGQMSNSSNEVVYVRGGGRYRIRTSHGVIPYLHTSSWTASGQSVSPTTTKPADSLRTNALITDNVASATKLQTARKIYGVDFNGTADVNGAFLWNNGDATLRIYDIGSYVNSAYGNETIGIQSCFDGQDPQTSSYVTSYYDRCLIALQPRGGRVAIGKTSAGFPLDVKGDIMADGWVRTTGAHGWYNQTYGGGWHMDNASWIKAYNKPVYIAYTTPDGPAHFGVGLRCYHASYTSVEVQGGSYTMGLGCHSDGRWYWWRGSASGKGYVMQYDGTTWAFNGVIKTSTGMYSEGYMSCLGKNTGSDARLKTILGDVTLPIEVILGAPAKKFRWNASAGPTMAGKIAVGTIAQYWLDRLPEVVGTMPTGYYGVNYGTLDWIAIHSVAKYAKTEIELLKEENQRLKERVAALERRLAA